MPTEASFPELKAHRTDPSHTTAREVPEQTGPSLLDVLALVIERRRFIGWVTSASIVLGACVALILPNRYTATVTLLPPQQNSSISAAVASQLGSLGGVAALAGGSLGLKNSNDLYVAMFRSRTVEDAMIERFALLNEYHVPRMSDGRKQFEKHTAIENGIKDGLIHISVSDHDAKRASELANGYVNQFRSLSEHLAITEASQRRLFFEKQIEQAKDHLVDAEEALKRTEQSTGLIQLDSQARALVESAALLRGQIAAKEVQIHAMETYATGQNSQLIQAQSELQTLRSELSKLGSSEPAIDGEIIVPKGKVPEASLEYVRKVRDVKYYETIFEILARQFELAKLDEAKQGAVIQVVDMAVPPDKKSFPPRSLITLGAALTGLVIAVCIVSLQNAWTRIKSDPTASESIARMSAGWSTSHKTNKRQ